jgi:hypothetical protein
MIAFLIPEDATSPEQIEVISPKNGNDFNLEELYNHLHCDTVEVVYLSSYDIMLIDESGRINDRPRNVFATRLYLATRQSKEETKKQLAEFEKQGFAIILPPEEYMDDPYIAGDAIICPKEMFT